MREKLSRYLALTLILLLVSSVCFLFACRKSGMFIDEIYTYGLSNSSFAPFLSSLKDGDMNGKVFSRDELFDYVAVTGDEGFDFASVYYNQANDVHPPLYYWLFNIASTIAKGSFSKWTGLILDYFIYIAAVIMLYRLVRKLGWSRDCACAAAVLYGLSVIGLSTMIMIRMYVLLALLTIVLAYFIACMMAEFSPKYCVFSGLTLLCGMMTQYYFVFYAFFLCAAFVIYLLAKKQYGVLKWFVPCAVIGAGAVVVLFPACLEQLFSGKLVSGGSAVDNLKNLAQYPARLKTFTAAAVHGLKAGIYVSLFCLAALAVCFGKLKKACRSGSVSFDALVFIIPAFITFILVAVISPVDEPRYIYNIVPMFILAAAFLLHLLEESVGDIKNRKIYSKAALALIAAAALWEARCAPPDYLYPEYARYDECLADYASVPCVYFSDNHFEGPTQDLLQLLIFDGFYVSPEKDLDKALDYVGGSECFVAFVDISEFWGSGYDAGLLIDSISGSSDFRKAELLYQNGLSATYLLSK